MSDHNNNPVYAFKQQGSKAPKSGLSRELHALTGGRVSLTSSVDPFKGLKQKRRTPSQQKPIKKWEWKEIKSSARKDELKLYHWERCDFKCIYINNSFSQFSRYSHY